MGEIGEPVLGQHVLHALARALAPERHDHALARRLQRLHVLGHGVEHAGCVVGALGREVMALPRAGIDARAARRPARRTA